MSESPGGMRGRPVTVSVSMGDPAGIGAEVIVKALADGALRRSARFRIYGVAACMDEAARLAGIDPFWWRIGAGSDALDTTLSHDVVLVDHAWSNEAGLGLGLGPSLGPSLGSGLGSGLGPGPGMGVTRETGALSFGFVESAIADALRGAGDPLRADAVCTAPIHKEAWALAGRKKYPGHTELLAARCRAKRVGMMFDSPELRVILATAHIPLMEIRNALTIGRVFDAIDLGADACRMLGIESARIAVCGLNPHAGEGGLLGDEEERLIKPAIDLARAQGIDASGPFPADTIFGKARAGAYDLVVAMYHDQGLIPVKLLAWDRAVNMTVGLGIVRTSPDHGTGLDIAYRNRANPGSMVAALRLAVRLAQERSAG